MIGIVLAGGEGTRMGLFTKRIGNKHLMPIYDRLMIEFPIRTLVQSGIKKITIVTGSRYSGQFIDLLGDGKEWGIEQLSYAYQFGSGGIADALRCAKPFVGYGESMCVVLGDNVFQDTIPKNLIKSSIPCIFTKHVDNPKDFGVVKYDKRGAIVDIIEKPVNPPSNDAVVGLYIYPYNVFNIVETIKPSKRGELEITDVNKFYLEQKNSYLLSYKINGYWADAGTPDNLIKVSQWYAKNRNKLKGFPKIGRAK